MAQANNVQTMVDAFNKVFGNVDPQIIARAPGRVNLIGEHTDYNEGFVFPMALGFQILTAARQRGDRLVRIHSLDYQKTVEFSLDDPIGYDAENRWSNYPRGVFSVLLEQGIKLSGMDLAFAGDIPQGSGLSSSAALEVGVGITLQALNGFPMNGPELARLCQRAENTFVGMNCGIMDQFISMMGQKDHALFLDCRSLDYRLIPLELGQYRVVICHSGVKHSLVDSEYNKRRRECEAGVAVLSRKFPQVKSLRDATLDELEACRGELDSVVYQRCRHVITENYRVLQSIDSLNQNDLKTFGKLMNESHDSLRDDYQVSCSEIDLLVEFARNTKGVLGSRITGGGFGGCTVNLISNSEIEAFSTRLTGYYQKETGITPHLYISTPAAGAEIIFRR
ncbi:MAG: galactokinase [Bacteroidota bacterium]